MVVVIGSSELIAVIDLAVVIDLVAAIGLAVVIGAAVAIGVTVAIDLVVAIDLATVIDHVVAICLDAAIGSTVPVCIPSAPGSHQYATQSDRLDPRCRCRFAVRSRLAVCLVSCPVLLYSGFVQPCAFLRLPLQQ